MKYSQILDFEPAQEELLRLQSIFIRSLPTVLLVLVLLIISVGLFRLCSVGLRRLLKKYILSPVLLNATARVLAVPTLLIGLYLILRISGLTGLALTLVGGTGIFSLVLGLSLKDIFDNYSAGIFLSIRKPFLPGDWVKIGEYEGIVQQVTPRSTLLMEFEGNHVLIPNNLVYKSVIINKTANPKMRIDFVIGIDYEDSIEDAQKEILIVLKSTPLVLRDPEPWVLVDCLASSTVDLKIYAWLNVRNLSYLKVTSYLLLEVKKRLLAKGFHFPDPQRERTFTNSLTISRTPSTSKSFQTHQPVSRTPDFSDMRSEAAELNRQAKESDLPDQGIDIFSRTHASEDSKDQNHAPT